MTQHREQRNEVLVGGAGSIGLVMASEMTRPVRPPLLHGLWPSFLARLSLCTYGSD